MQNNKYWTLKGLLLFATLSFVSLSGFATSSNPIYGMLITCENASYVAICSQSMGSRGILGQPQWIFSKQNELHNELHTVGSQYVDITKCVPPSDKTKLIQYFNSSNPTLKNCHLAGSVKVSS